MLASSSRFAVLALTLPLALAGCGNRQAEFSVKSARDVTTRDGTVSVFGVFRDGRLESGSWEEIGAAFGDGKCPVGFDETLRVSHPDVATTIDSQTRADGVGDEVLQKIEAQAQGDYVLLVTIYGHLPTKKERTARNAGAPNFTSGQAPSRAGGRKGMRPTASDEEQLPLHGGLQVSTTLYAKRTHNTVAALEMDYTGSTLEGAFAAFWQKWNAEFPGLACRGWAWGADSAPPKTGPRATAETASPATVP